MNIDLLNNLSDVSETLLLPLYARAIESRSKNPILKDKKAVEITNQLNEILKDSDLLIHKKLISGKLEKKLPVTMALRSKQIDKFVNDFINKNKNPIIITLGCGLGTRYSRLKPKNVLWYDLDFAEVIEIRKNFFKETKNYHLIGSSVLNFEWMDLIDSKDKQVLIVAEGLLMYLHENEVKSLILELQKKFSNCELVAELSSKYIVKVLHKNLYKKKFQKKFNLGKDAVFNFGVDSSGELEEWDSKIKLLDEWSYFDPKEKKLGWINYLKIFKRVRNAQFIVHYKLN